MDGRDYVFERKLQLIPSAVEKATAKWREERVDLQPDSIAWHAAMWFWTNGEWPTPEDMWHRLTKSMFDDVAYSVEEARQACIAACDEGDIVYGIPTVAALSLGEVLVDPFVSDANANPFRIAAKLETMQELGASPHFQRAVLRKRVA